MARELNKASTEELLLLASGPAEEPLLALVVAELVMRYKGVVYNHALRICGGNRALADETFQETFLRLFEWLRSRHDKGTLHTFPYLLSVFTKRVAIDLMRRENRQTPTGSLHEAEALPATEEPSFETRAYVVELLEMLDDRSREVIRLTYFDELSAVEIAQKLGLSPGNVRVLRFRALEALRGMQLRDQMADSIEPL
jgi:RNA polymerase sigma-70 factor (ECF subfamily)